MTEPLDPDRLEQVEFSMVRRGLDPAAVRSTLAEAADGLRLMTRRCHELEHRIETLEAQVPEPDSLEREREDARAEGGAAGQAEAEQQLEEARSEAETLVAAAKEEGRQLVGEAQTVRRRMLEDLARRRRSLRQQIEQLRGGRERLLEAYEVVGHTMREATAELSAALPEARAAAERAGHGVGPEETVEQLEAEIEAARLAGLPIVAAQARPDEPETSPAERRRPVAVPLERDVRDMREVEPVVADFEEVRVLTDDDADEPADEAVPDVAGYPASDEARSDERAVGEPEGADGPDDGEPAEDDQSGRESDSEPAADSQDPAPPEGDGTAEDAVEATGRDDHAGETDDETDDEVEAQTDDRGSDSDEADGQGEDDDLFTRLRRSRSEAEEVAESEDRASDRSEVAPASEAPDAEPAPAPEADPSTLDEFDHPDDASEPFGLALGSELEEGSPTSAAAEERATAEHELARHLKRLLSDEQNDVLDRLRRTRKRSLVVSDLLDDFDDRVTRFAAAVLPVLTSAAESEAGVDAHPVDDLAAELAREVAEALADGMVEPLEEEVPVDELAGPVRALYRTWKTDRIGTVAERYVQAACEPQPEAD